LPIASQQPLLQNLLRFETYLNAIAQFYVLKIEVVNMINAFIQLQAKLKMFPQLFGFLDESKWEKLDLQTDHERDCLSHSMSQTFNLNSLPTVRMILNQEYTSIDAILNPSC